MNVSLTTSPVSEKNIQWQVYPDTGFVRRVLCSEAFQSGHIHTGLAAQILAQ